MFEDEEGRICLTDDRGEVYVYEINVNSTGNVKMKLGNRFKLVNLRDSIMVDNM